MQDEVFAQGEGDRYHERNRLKYITMIDNDPVLLVLKASGIQPQHVLEIGCATGWRLEEIRKRYGARCLGIDPSDKAIEEGRALYNVPLMAGLLEDMYLNTADYDLIVLSFVLHWVDRAKLLKMLAEIDRMLKADGCLAISDFMPLWPTKVPYRHREGIWTYKARYDDILRATGCYETHMAMLFNVETLRECYTDESRQAKCTLLRKGDYYQESK